MDEFCAVSSMLLPSTASAADLATVHGGLSPDIVTLDQMRLIDRNQEIPHEGAFCGDPLPLLKEAP